MDSFFDTSTVINYASFSKSVNHQINKICFDYISSKKGAYLLCYYVKEEIENRIKKRKIIHREVINKLKDKYYEIGESELGQNLSDRDIVYAKKLYEIYKNEKVEEVSIILLSERAEFEKKIEFFFKAMVNEIMLNKEDIDKGLINIIHEMIDEYADCRVLASAIQIQQNKPVFLFVTVDKEHFNPNSYDFVKTDSRLEKYKFPELRNLWH